MNFVLLFLLVLYLAIGLVYGLTLTVLFRHWPGWRELAEIVFFWPLLFGRLK